MQRCFAQHDKVAFFSILLSRGRASSPAWAMTVHAARNSKWIAPVENAMIHGL
jgi:hypothetical protein